MLRSILDGLDVRKTWNSTACRPQLAQALAHNNIPETSLIFLILFFQKLLFIMKGSDDIIAFKFLDGLKVKWQDMRLTNNTGIKVIVTDCESTTSGLPSPRSLQLLFRSFPKLQRIESEFHPFLTTVRSDLIEKSTTLKSLRERKDSNKLDKNHANVQLFMIQQYSQRLEQFDFLCKQSLLKLSQRFLCGEELEAKVEKHISILTKMKRRMKMILDVSEKYVTLEMAEAVDQMKEFCDELTRIQTKSALSSSLNNVLEEKEVFALSWRSRSLSDSLSADSERQVPKRNTIKSITEHLQIMTKTFAYKWRMDFISLCKC